MKDETCLIHSHAALPSYRQRLLAALATTPQDAGPSPTQPPKATSVPAVPVPRFRERLRQAIGIPDRVDLPSQPWKKSLTDQRAGLDYIEDSLLPRDVELPPFGAMTCVIAPDRDCAMDQHNQDEMVFVYRGAGEVHIEGRVIPVATGDTVFIPRNRKHTVINRDTEHELAFFSVWWPRVAPV